ncbi:hypothetical protein [Bacterioplanoides pacificum]|uniref:Lipoprotein n=1 Tax=Bacterioplanoides pacificum TaxID=1171596 RepID=A0ABV7VTQ9_9GAMM
MRQFLPLRQYFSFTLLATVCCLQACSNTSDEVKASSDFATADIRAEYSVIVRPDNGEFSYQMEARFKNGDNNLQLDGGDRVVAERGRQTYQLKEERLLNQIVYSASFNISADDSDDTVNFAFLRDEKVSAVQSNVHIPEVLNVLEPASSSSVGLTTSGNLNISWEKNDSGNAPLVIAQQYHCTVQGSSKTLDLVAAVKTGDNGSHLLQVGEVVDISDYDECSLNLRLTRTKKGELDPEFSGGSSNGLFIAEVKDITVALQ